MSGIIASEITTSKVLALQQRERLARRVHDRGVEAADLLQREPEQPLRDRVVVDREHAQLRAGRSARGGGSLHSGARAAAARARPRRGLGLGGWLRAACVLGEIGELARELAHRGGRRHARALLELAGELGQVVVAVAAGDAAQLVALGLERLARARVAGLDARRELAQDRARARRARSPSCA